MAQQLSDFLVIDVLWKRAGVLSEQIAQQIEFEQDDRIYRRLHLSRVVLASLAAEKLQVQNFLDSSNGMVRRTKRSRPIVKNSFRCSSFFPCIEPLPDHDHPAREGPPTQIERVWQRPRSLTLPVGCRNQNNPNADLVGTLQMTTGGHTETLVFTTTSLDATDTGSITGTVVFSIQSFDTGAKHVQTPVTASAGHRSTMTPGTSVFMTCSISGDTIYVSDNTDTYPPSAATGPFIRQ